MLKLFFSLLILAGLALAAVLAAVPTLEPTEVGAPSPFSSTSSSALATPALYTNGNAGDVFDHPVRHLGARVQLTAEVVSVRRGEHAVVLSARVGRKPLALRIFDSRFSPSPGDTVKVSGTVRGALGDPSRVVELDPSPSMRRGLAVIDASAASIVQA